MRPWLARRHWNLHARTDPLWAVLTDGDKRGNRWTVDEFFATGVAAIHDELARIRAFAPRWNTHRALDFGCGVGRLSQALASTFAEVVGVDISTDMLAHAQRYNRHGDRVRYLENATADLAQFPDGHFDLVLSLITLQHIDPAVGRRYLAEFTRVCAPGGIILVQVPSHRVVPSPGLSLWPPTVWMRLKRAWKRLTVREATMDMHAIPQSEVMALLTSGGAVTLAVEPLEVSGPEFASYRYIAKKTTDSRPAALGGTQL